MDDASLNPLPPFFFLILPTMEELSGKTVKDAIMNPGSSLYIGLPPLGFYALFRGFE